MRTFSLILFAALAVSLSAQETLRGRFDTSRGFTPLFDGKSLDGWVTKGGRYDGAAIWKITQAPASSKAHSKVVEGPTLYCQRRASRLTILPGPMLTR